MMMMMKDVTKMSKEKYLVIHKKLTIPLSNFTNEKTITAAVRNQMDLIDLHDSIV